MKRILVLALTFLAFYATPAWADIDGFIGVATVDEYAGVSTVDEVVGQTVAGGSTCETVIISNTGSRVNDYDVTDSANAYYAGHHFSDELSDTICGIGFYPTKELGDISAKTYTAYIYTHDASGNLDTLQATSDGEPGVNTWDDTLVIFYLSTPFTPSNGTRYAFVVSTGSVDASNYAALEQTNSGALDGLAGQWQSGGTRSTSSGNDTKMVLYKE